MMAKSPRDRLDPWLAFKIDRDATGSLKRRAIEL
jgi:hypothetical protein